MSKLVSIFRERSELSVKFKIVDAFKDNSQYEIKTRQSEEKIKRIEFMRLGKKMMKSFMSNWNLVIKDRQLTDRIKKIWSMNTQKLIFRSLKHWLSSIQSDKWKEQAAVDQYNHTLLKQSFAFFTNLRKQSLMTRLAVSFDKKRLFNIFIRLHSIQQQSNDYEDSLTITAFQYWEIAL